MLFSSCKMVCSADSWPRASGARSRVPAARTPTRPCWPGMAFSQLSRIASHVRGGLHVTGVAPATLAHQSPRLRQRRFSGGPPSRTRRKRFLTRMFPRRFLRFRFLPGSAHPAARPRRSTCRRTCRRRPRQATPRTCRSSRRSARFGIEQDG